MVTTPPENSKAMIEAARHAQSELFDIVKDIISGASLQDLSGTPALLDRMEAIVGRFGLTDNELSTQLADIRHASLATDHRIRLSNAAAWAGDLDRMRALQEVPWPETRHLIGALPQDCDAEAVGPDDTPPDAETADPYADLAKGLPGALEALITSGQDLNQLAGEHGRTAFQAALEAPGRRAETLERLIAAGADPSLPGPFGEDAIFCAIGYRHHDSVTAESEQRLFDVLFRAGSDPNAQGDGFGTAMLASILLGSPVEVAVMLDAGGVLTGAYPERYPGDPLAGFTPLMLAAPRPDTFRLLLDRGADPARICPGGISLTDFLKRELARAEELAEQDDWCRAHAQALASSLALLTKA